MLRFLFLLLALPVLAGPFEVSIDESGSYALGDQAITLEDLAAKIAEAAKADMDGTLSAMVVRAKSHAGAPSGAFLQLVQACARGLVVTIELEVGDHSVKVVLPKDVGLTLVEVTREGTEVVPQKDDGLTPPDKGGARKEIRLHMCGGDAAGHMAAPRGHAAKCKDAGRPAEIRGWLDADAAAAAVLDVEASKALARRAHDARTAAGDSSKVVLTVDWNVPCESLRVVVAALTMLGSRPEFSAPIE